MRFAPNVRMMQFAAYAAALVMLAAAPAPASRALAPAALQGAYLGPIAPRTQISLYVSLHGQHPGELDRLIQAQNTPGSPAFRHYVTPQQFGRYFGAGERDYLDAIVALRARGFIVDDLPANHLDIGVHASASVVESFFGTPIDLRRTAHGRVFYTNRYEPELPAGLHLLAVEGLDDYVQFRPRLRTARPMQTIGTTTAWSPADIQSAYDLTPLYPQYEGQGETIVDATYGLVRGSDFRAFKTQFGLGAKLVQVSIGNAPLDPGGESTLDVEWMAAIAPSVRILLVSPSNTGNGFNRMYQYIVNSLSKDHLISTSWGSCEQSIYGTFGPTQRLFAQAQAEGQWWMAAAGDQGSDDCNRPAYGPVAVDYPGSSPYVMSVGGTHLTPASTSGGNYTGWADERVWNGGSNCGAGGGGTSKVFVEPAYQKLVLPAGYMREVPDVALMADDCDRGGYFIYFKGALQDGEGGTSFAAPEWTAFLSLIAQRYGTTPIQSPLYRLYQLAASPAYHSLFHDIVTGNNSYLGVPGFSAGPGYDQASGLGSFIGAPLQAAY